MLDKNSVTHIYTARVNTEKCYYNIHNACGKNIICTYESTCDVRICNGERQC